MISTNDFRPGVVVTLDGDLYAVVSSQHVKRGRGSAYVRAKVRNLKTGAITERTFNAGERVPHAFLERREMQYLYHQDTEYVFMDQQTYEQASLSADLLGDATRYLRDNTVVTVVYFESRPIAVELPNAVDLAVTDTSPGIRGDTASGGSKPATLETGAVVSVPLFVEVGDVVRVDTRTGEYLERVG
ncbi:MAG: elongation factor P [Armatimonadetes bacterium]|nr:elongation factor P [Armatimonadota bacterium]